MLWLAKTIELFANVKGLTKGKWTVVEVLTHIDTMKLLGPYSDEYVFVRYSVIANAVQAGDAKYED
jgi:hypothetical protein